MIGWIHGKILEKQPPVLLLNVNGIGYEIEASMHTFYKLPEIDKEVILYTHLVVREDAHLLYGFADKEERGLFRTLIKVNGVGPKLALTLLSSVTPAEFRQYIQDNNSPALMRLPGVGKKTAERLIIEMRDRLKNIPFADTPTEGAIVMNFTHTPEQEAISALITLGYKPVEASKAVGKVDTKGLSSEEIIKKALQGMVAKI